MERLAYASRLPALAAAGFCLFALIVPAVKALQGLPAGFVEIVVPTTEYPIIEGSAMAVAPDGRIFIAERHGAIRIVKAGALLAMPFHVVPVSTSDGDLGLKGIAIEPNFATDTEQYVYVHYTGINTAGEFREVVARITANEANPDIALVGSEVAVFTYPDTLDNVNTHNTAALHFGPDGMLYVGHGMLADGNNAQSMTSLYGKILRVNKNGSIPEDNPFYTTAIGEYRSIFALGLRNPWTFTFGGNDTMYIADVGENQWEEVNRLRMDAGPAERNFGWPVCEGGCQQSLTADPLTSFSDPIYTYAHPATNTGFLPSGTNPRGCSIIGAAVYDPPVPSFPDSYENMLFFTDFCTGEIMMIQPDGESPLQSTQFATGLLFPSNIVIDHTDGSLLYLTWGDSAYNPSVVGRVSYSTRAMRAVFTTQPAADTTVAIGQTATFTVEASGTGPISYQWQVAAPWTPWMYNDIAGATEHVYVTPILALTDSGQSYRCIATNSLPSMATSERSQLLVINDNAPVVTITTPTENSFYRGGETITFSASAIDVEEGELPGNMLTWTSQLHHGVEGVDLHTHPVFGQMPGIGGTFTIPVAGEVSPHQYFSITCEARDSAGSATTATINIRPLLVPVTLAAIPPGIGLHLGLDAPGIETPFTVQGLAGQTRSLSALSPQGPLNGKMYIFANWSDGGAESHTTARVPESGVVFTATFVEETSGPVLTTQAPRVAATSSAAGKFTSLVSLVGLVALLTAASSDLLIRDE